jgi:branched-chain amino acid transport system ATP-binding protein
MIELNGISASYGRVPAIGGVTISVGEGEAVGLLGANGAGKSTTLRAISGLVRLTAGSITFLGQDLASLPPTGSQSWASPMCRRAARYFRK